MKARVDVEGMEGFFEVERWPQSDDYWNIAYRVSYNTCENHKGYKRHKTVKVGKRGSARNSAYNIRWGVNELYRRIFGYRAYRNLVYGIRA